MTAHTRAMHVRLVAICIAAACTAGIPTATRQQPASVLRVCADPNNLPFSNDKQEGFENRLARLVASDLGLSLEYEWWPQRRGFIRNTLDAGRCDVVMGVPARYGLTLTTEPYYRSTYVFVSRRGRYSGLGSLEDARLRGLKIGVQMIGDDFANSPPAHALSARGLTRNIAGYSVLGDYSQPNPPARIVDAVARGEVDAAIVWGPLAGYFASRAAVPLEITRVIDPGDAALPFTFDISMGVRSNDRERKRVLDGVIERRRTYIRRLLSEYGVPQVTVTSGPNKS